MTRTQRLARVARVAPVWRFATARSREAARLAARVDELERELAVATHQRDETMAALRAERARRWVRYSAGGRTW